MTKLTKPQAERPIKAPDILLALQGGEPFAKSGEWLMASELRFSTGFTLERKIDFWLMNMYPSKLFVKYAFEIKISKGDFARELRDPLKNKIARAYSNYFYFVAPVGVIDPMKLPHGVGLLEAHWGYQDKMYLGVKVPALFSDSEPPTWGLVAEIYRKAKKVGK